MRECTWAKSHNGVTCREATAKSAYWCLACKRAEGAIADGQSDPETNGLAPQPTTDAIGPERSG